MVDHAHNLSIHDAEARNRTIGAHCKTVVERLFVSHPRDVDETYWQHFKVATSFAGALLAAAAACAVHALIPGLCTSTASRRIGALHDAMVLHRRRQPADAEG